MLLTVLRTLAALVGSLAFYARLFMYEDEQGRWQNRIERLWMGIDDRAKVISSTTSALFGKLSTVVTRTFDKLFGPKLFSLRAVGVSTSYSVAGEFLVGFVLSAVLPWLSNRFNDPIPQEIMKYWPLFEVAFFLGGLIFLLLALLPSLFRSRWFVRLSLFPVLFFGGCGLSLSLIQERHRWHHVGVAVDLLAGFLSDILLIALVRFTVRWISAKTSAVRIIVAMLIQVGLLILVVFAPFAIGAGLIDTFGPRSMFVGVIGVASYNLFTGLVSGLFLFVLLFVLLHKVFWPVLGRLFYPLARYEVMRNRKMLTGIGTICYIFAFPVTPNVLKSILEWLAK